MEESAVPFGNLEEHTENLGNTLGTSKFKRSKHCTLFERKHTRLLGCILNPFLSRLMCPLHEGGYLLSIYEAR
jgi:hypothetical protein